MKKKTLTPSNIIFAIFIVLLIIPQTRTFLQVGVNKIKVQLFSPSALDSKDQTQLDPFIYDVIDLKNQPKKISIGEGRVVFLSYWATWCPPCIAELSSIQELYNDYGDKIEFVLLTDEKIETVNTFLEKKKYSLPVYLPRMQTPEKLYERSIPTNYIIDGTGKIIVKEQGASNWNSTKVRAVLDGLIMN